MTRAPALPTDLGMMRTIMAADRTLMAWVRTAFSMLSFSFTIYKFLDAQKDLPHPNSPQQAGLFLAGMGTVSMVLGTFSYWSTLRDLQRTEEFRLGRPTLLMATIVSIVGVLLFGAIWGRVV